MLHLNQNQLCDIKWTKFNKLYSLGVANNQLSADILTRVLDALPKAPNATPEEQDSLKWGVADISENPGTSNANTIKATENGWKVITTGTTGIFKQQAESKSYLRYNQAENSICKTDSC